MNGAHNYHKNIKMYVLLCTTIGLKQECGHETSRRADMNLRVKPHFTAKIGQFFVPTSQKMRLCVDVIWRHSCCINPYWEGYTNIYRVIGITLLAISHCIYRVGDNRRPVNTLTVRIFLISWRQKTSDIYCYVDLSSWYEIWFAIICIDMNVILDLPTMIQQF